MSCLEDDFDYWLRVVEEKGKRRKNGVRVKLEGQEKWKPEKNGRKNELEGAEKGMKGKKYEEIYGGRKKNCRI